MALEPLPYYKWFVRDYRAHRKVQRMGYIAKGFYRELLDEAWIEGSLPTDIEGLSEICGCPTSVMVKAWPEIAPCFEERDGRLFNNKMENQRTEKDLERVKRAHAGKAGAIAKQVLASAEQVPASADGGQASASKCHIEEKSREEKSKEKPCRADAATGDKMKHSSDPRHIAFKAEIGKYWEAKNPGVQMPWGGHEGKELGMWLREAPEITVEQFTGFLRNRFRSEVNHGERPSQWIKWITSFAAGPMDRFGKTIGESDGKSNRSPAKERIDSGRSALAEIAVELGLVNPAGRDGAPHAPLSDAGPGRDGQGVLSGLRTVGPEILAPEGKSSAGGIAH